MSNIEPSDFLSNYIEIFEKPSTDYYEVLSVSREASAEEIEKSFNQIWRTHRPDINKSQNVDIALVNKAHKELSNPFTRIMYDTAMGYKPNNNNTRVECNRLKMLLSESYNLSSLETYKNLVQEEQAYTDKGERGLVIVSARYGHTSDFKQNGNPPYVDVKVSLQCMSHNGQIQSPLVYSLFCHDGFYLPYDPKRKGELISNPVLEVYYKYGQHLHRAVFNDFDQITIPLQSHLLSEEEALEYELNAIRNSPSERAIRRRRRMFLFYSGALLLLGAASFSFYLFTNKSNPFLPKKTKAPQ